MSTSFLRAEVRSILCKNRIDLGPLRVGVYESSVRLQGVLRRVAGVTELTHEALENLELELRRIPGVRRVEMHLTNWNRQASEWRPKAASAQAGVESKVYVLTTSGTAGRGEVALLTEENDPAASPAGTPSTSAA